MHQFAGHISRTAVAVGTMSVQCITYVGGMPDQIKSASVTLEVDGRQMTHTTTSETGPIDAIFRSIVEIAGCKDVVLEKFQIDSVGEGSAALAVARARVSIGERVVIEEGRDVDTLCAAARAFAVALNKLRS